MKKVINLILLINPLICTFSNTVYVGADGNNTSSGTISDPFATVSYAITVTGPGDTIFILGGIYELTSTISIGSSESGSEGSPCYLLGYPGETIVFDFYRQDFGDRAFSLSADYWFIKGITICRAGDNGIHISGNHNHIEQCIFHGNDDSGLQISGGGSFNIVINCDSYNNADPDNGDADGFAAKLDIGPGNEFYGCRSWNNSDDGWDLFDANDSVVIDNCWTFSNGYLPNGSESVGEGNGFKLGGNYVKGNHLVKNCISFDNKRYGYHQNNNIGLITIYNSIGLNNSGRNFNFNNDTIKPNILTNNISINSGSDDKFDRCTMLTNSWQGIPADEVDFLSLDPTLAKDARMPDGSLPSNNFAKLDPGSNLVDNGTPTGYPYTGEAPDLGAFEISNPDAEYILSITTTGEGGVWLSPAGGVYDSGTVVILTAWNTGNYIFGSWSGDADGTNDTLIMVMDTSKSVAANFIPITDPDPDSMRIEAEDLILQDYIFERIAGASNGKVVRPLTSAFCSGRSVFHGEASWFRVNVCYIDVFNGAAAYQLSVNNEVIQAWAGDSVSEGSSFIIRPVENVYMNDGDELKIESKPGGQEYGRLDYLDLIRSEYVPGLSLTRTQSRGISLAVYPNPFDSKLNIEITLERPLQVYIDIISPDGKILNSLIKEFDSGGLFTIDIAPDNILPGIYLVRGISTEKIFLIPVIKNR